MSIAAMADRRAFLCMFLWFCLYLSPGSARAESMEPIDLARGLRVEAVDRVPTVRRGDVRAPLIKGPVFGFSAERNETQIELIRDECWTFGEPETYQFTLDMLEARVENAAALKLHRAGKHAEAATGFRSALRLDPKFLLATFNLASALNLAGHRAEAAAVLVPHLEHKLVHVYLAALQDAELTPLLQEPPLSALKSTPPGTAVLRKWEPGWIAYSAKHGRLAVLDLHDGLRVYSLKTGARDTVLDLGDRVLQASMGSPSAREEAQLRREQQAQRVRAGRVIDRKRPLIDRMLADLGFVEVKQRDVGTIERLSDERTAQFPGSGLLLTAGDRGLRLLKNDRLLHSYENADSSQRLDAAIWLPTLGTLVWQWTRGSGPTDCHRQGGTEVWVLPKGAPSR